jgi:hypothetical protein
MKMILAEPKLKFLPAGAIFWLVREGLREGPTIFVDHPDRFTNVSRSSPVAGVLWVVFASPSAAYATASKARRPRATTETRIAPEKSRANSSGRSVV